LIAAKEIYKLKRGKRGGGKGEGGGIACMSPARGEKKKNHIFGFGGRKVHSQRASKGKKRGVGRKEGGGRGEQLSTSWKGNPSKKKDAQSPRKEKVTVLKKGEKGGETLAPNAGKKGR